MAFEWPSGRLKEGYGSLHSHSELAVEPRVAYGMRTYDRLDLHGSRRCTGIHIHVKSAHYRYVEYDVANVARFIDALEAHGYFTSSKPLVVVACCTAAGPTPFAHDLAHAVGREIIAPDADAYADGIPYVHPPGRWWRFLPDGRKLPAPMLTRADGEIAIDSRGIGRLSRRA